MNNSTDDIAAYFQNRFFLFVPNICNARCEFCYVAPGFSNRSRVSQEAISRLFQFIENLGALGFDEVRLTGGEPLIFEQLQEVVEFIKSIGMTYTVLTNGINLVDFEEMFERFPPAKITVSLHSAEYSSESFGVAYPFDQVTAAVERMSGRCHLAATVVCIDAAMERLDATVRSLSAMKFRELKLVVPNNCNSATRSAEIFSTLGSKAVEYGHLFEAVRVTDRAQKSCLLNTAGSLSLTLPSFEFFECCAMVGNGGGRRLDSIEALKPLLESFVSKGARYTTPPCKTDLGCCPISLRGFS